MALLLVMVTLQQIQECAVEMVTVLHKTIVPVILVGLEQIVALCSHVTDSHLMVLKFVEIVMVHALLLIPALVMKIIQDQAALFQFAMVCWLVTVHLHALHMVLV